MLTSTVTDLAKHLVYDPDFNDDDPRYSRALNTIPRYHQPFHSRRFRSTGRRITWDHPQHRRRNRDCVAALPPVEGTVPRSESAEPVQQHS